MLLCYKSLMAFEEMKHQNQSTRRSRSSQMTSAVSSAQRQSNVSVQRLRQARIISYRQRVDPNDVRCLLCVIHVQSKFSDCTYSSSIKNQWNWRHRCATDVRSELVRFPGHINRLPLIRIMNSRINYICKLECISVKMADGLLRNIWKNWLGFDSQPTGNTPLGT
jgi:hypothetical protein